MREIKFRGKTFGNEWVYGNLIRQIKDDGIESCYIRPIKIDSNPVSITHIDKNTISQFTGLTDKNGKEIYEGDILYKNFWGKLDDKTPIICKYRNGSICFTKQDFWDYGNNHERGFGWNVRFNKKRIKECEIVGNIHDNPELIKE